MFEITTVKNIQGSIELPPHSDYFILATIQALLSDQTVHISNPPDNPLCESWKETTKAHLQFENNDNGLVVTPRENSRHLPLTLNINALRYSHYIVFGLLGKGIPLHLSAISDKQIDLWLQLLKRAQIEPQLEIQDSSISLRLPPNTAVSFPEKKFTLEELEAFMGFATGRKTKFGGTITFPFSSPIRTSWSAFGQEIAVKSLVPEKSNDPIARRIERMQTKKKKENTPVEFRFLADFSHTSADPITLTLPGDDILGATLIAAKSLVQRGNLIIENMPLDTHNAAIISFIRKLGCAPGIQQQRITAYGAEGSIQLQRFSLSGRKIECVPLTHYRYQLPAMLVIALFASGQSLFRRLDYLRNEEPDGIKELLNHLDTIGAHFGEIADGIVCKGSSQYDGFDIDKPLQACTAAALIVCAMRCMGTSSIEDTALLQRWPDFKGLIDSICEFRS